MNTVKVPGGPLREAGLAIVFALSAGNLLVYTVKSFKATYTRPPLSTWQTGAGEKPSQGKETEKPPKGESLLESIPKKILENVVPSLPSVP